MRSRRLLILIICSFAIISSLQAGGTNFTPLFGARTLSLNGLYIAGTDGLNCSWTNPAGFAFMTGREINISLLDRMEQQEFESPTGGLHRSYRNDDLSLGGGVYYNIFPGMTAAFAYNKLIDYQVDWPYATYRRSDSLSSVAAFDMRNQLKVSAITPSFAIAFGDFALGLGLNVYYISQLIAFPVNNTRWQNGKGLLAYQFNYDQNAWSFGFNLGVLANLNDNLRLGISARSGVKTTLKGKANSLMFAQLDSDASSSDLSNEFKLPWIFSLGIVYKLSGSLSLNLDGSYSLWKNIKNNYTFTFSNQLWQQSLNAFDSLTGFQPGNFQFLTKNCIDAGLGLEYGSLDQGFSYRLGYRFSQSPIEPASYSLLLPSLDQHWMSIGVGYKSEDLYLDASVTYVLGVKKEVFRNGLPELSGTYRTNNVVPAITLHFNL
ncbi:MAG: OmpP1/FadL family transporter [Bacillota bacterium]